MFLTALDTPYPSPTRLDTSILDECMECTIYVYVLSLELAGVPSTHHADFTGRDGLKGVGKVR
jgi:hypothetical protein